MIDRSKVSADEADALNDSADRAVDRRARNKAAGKCINAPKNRPHDPPVPGRTKCQHCLDVAQHGARTVRIKLAARATRVVAGRSDAAVEAAIVAAPDDEERHN